MIQTYSSTIRRKEMEAVLTCMVDEKIGPGEMNQRLTQTYRELSGCDGCVALRSPSVALEYALKAISLPKESGIMISALAPFWQFAAIEKLGYKPVVLDVDMETSLVTVEKVQEGIKCGGRLLILHETMGILPSIKDFLELDIPVIEDISQSALSFYPLEEGEERKPLPSEESSSGEKNESEGELQEPKGKRAGSYGVYSILGMEDQDIVTAGGGAVLIAPCRKEWIVLKNLIQQAPSTDIMPDMNAALAFVELKEFARNEKVRRELFTLYSRSIMAGKHKTFIREKDFGSTIYSFPLLLNSGFKDVKSYGMHKGIEVKLAFEKSVIAVKNEEYSSQCMNASSIALRCALFPLYPRLGQKDVARIVKVLSSLP
ncbi:MAG: DegT/DnrJ/EryC1/StrS family aminotransferase [Treponema sp.]|nr:DegT/DnrJ/EryC1/StrS family aminotransferase [Spirochaetia bacterium]MDD7015160.1 DegT/DnrJ/EryC1/StrS family aminotransferase [Spirochaetales bacterium]MDY4902602.1 DegT/DnrJ/EryC1/StrS family aminotransferase [Treponema sp.]